MTYEDMIRDVVFWRVGVWNACTICRVHNFGAPTAAQNPFNWFMDEHSRKIGVNDSVCELEFQNHIVADHSHTMPNSLRQGTIFWQTRTSRIQINLLPMIVGKFYHLLHIDVELSFLFYFSYGTIYPCFINCVDMIIYM